MIVRTVLSLLHCVPIFTLLLFHVPVSPAQLIDGCLGKTST